MKTNRYQVESSFGLSCIDHEVTDVCDLDQVSSCFERRRVHKEVLKKHLKSLAINVFVVLGNLSLL